jgi:hypothetical protein
MLPLRTLGPRPGKWFKVREEIVLASFPTTPLFVMVVLNLIFFPLSALVMAPSTLPAGYQFEAELGEKKFMATVVRVTK